MFRYDFQVLPRKRVRYIVHTDLEDLFCKLAINFPNQDD